MGQNSSRIRPASGQPPIPTQLEASEATQTQYARKPTSKAPNLGLPIDVRAFTNPDAARDFFASVNSSNDSPLVTPASTPASSSTASVFSTTSQSQVPAISLSVPYPDLQSGSGVVELASINPGGDPLRLPQTTMSCIHHFMRHGEFLSAQGSKQTYMGAIGALTHPMQDGSTSFAGRMVHVTITDGDGAAKQHYYIKNEGVTGTAEPNLKYKIAYSSTDLESAPESGKIQTTASQRLVWYHLPEPVAPTIHETPEPAPEPDSQRTSVQAQHAVSTPAAIPVNPASPKEAQVTAIVHDPASHSYTIILQGSQTTLEAVLVENIRNNPRIKAYKILAPPTSDEKPSWLEFKFNSTANGDRMRRGSIRNPPPTYDHPPVD